MASDAPIVVCGMEFEADIARGPGIQVAYGLDPEKLAADMERAIAAGAKGLLSFGTAAGLSPALQAGSIILARHVLAGQESFSTDAVWTASLSKKLPEAVIADIAGVDAALACAESKAALHGESQAAVADMESHYVARTAAQHGLPFAAIRVVLDDAHSALPPAALAAARKDGGVDYPALLGSLFRQPAQLPALLRLARDHAKAKAALLRCGERLKPGAFGFNQR